MQIICLGITEESEAVMNHGVLSYQACRMVDTFYAKTRHIIVFVLMYSTQDGGVSPKWASGSRCLLWKL